MSASPTPEPDKPISPSQDEVREPPVPSEKETEPNPLLLEWDAPLRRASKDARRTARMYGTPLCVYGKAVDKKPRD